MVDTKKQISEPKMSSDKVARLDKVFSVSANIESRMRFHDDTTIESVCHLLGTDDRQNESGPACWVFADHSVVDEGWEKDDRFFENNAAEAAERCVRFLMLRGRYGTVENVRQLSQNRKEFGDWKYDETLSYFIDNMGGVAVYLNKATNSAFVIFTHRLEDYEMCHRMAACMFRLAFWVFEKHPLTDDEKRAIGSLSTNNAQEFIDACEKRYAAYDFRGIAIKNAFAGFAKRQREMEVDNLRRQIQDNIETVKEYGNYIRELLDRRRDYNFRLAGLTCFVDEKKDDELLEYVLACKAIHAVKTNDDGEVKIAVVTSLDLFDEDVFDSYVINCETRDSYLFRESPYSLDDTKALYKAIWLDKEFSLTVWGLWRVMATARVQCVSRETPGDIDEIRNAVPNPHLCYYACIGDYENLFADAYDRHDVMGALQIAVQSTKSINFAEEPTAKMLIRDMFRDIDKKVLVDKDGNAVSIRDAMQILKDEGKLPDGEI